MLALSDSLVQPFTGKSSRAATDYRSSVNRGLLAPATAATQSAADAPGGGGRPGGPGPRSNIHGFKRASATARARFAPLMQHRRAQRAARRRMIRACRVRHGGALTVLAGRRPDGHQLRTWSRLCDVAAGNLRIRRCRLPCLCVAALKTSMRGTFRRAGAAHMARSPRCRLASNPSDIRGLCCLRVKGTRGATETLRRNRPLKRRLEWPMPHHRGFM